MAFLGKPVRVYKNSEGDLGFMFHYKYGHSDRICSRFYTMEKLSSYARELIERAIKDGDYLYAGRSYDYGIRFVDGVATVVADFVAGRSSTSVPSDLIIKGYCPVKTGQGQYKVSL